MLRARTYGQSLKQQSQLLRNNDLRLVQSHRFGARRSFTVRAMLAVFVLVVADHVSEEALLDPTARFGEREDGFACGAVLCAQKDESGRLGEADWEDIEGDGEIVERVLAKDRSLLDQLTDHVGDSSRKPETASPLDEGLMCAMRCPSIPDGLDTLPLAPR